MGIGSARSYLSKCPGYGVRNGGGAPGCLPRGGGIRMIFGGSYWVAVGALLEFVSNVSHGSISV